MQQHYFWQCLLNLTKIILLQRDFLDFRWICCLKVTVLYIYLVVWGVMDWAFSIWGINFTNSVIFMLFSSIITPLLSNNLRLQASPQSSPERSPDLEIEINLKDFRWVKFPYFNKWCFNPPTPKIVANQTFKGLLYYWLVYQVIH